MESNKIFNLLDKAIQILDRCWEGYKPVAGVKPYEAGSCEKEMATQSDMGEIEEVIAMLDKAIKFYDPSQDRDESGKWSGSGGGSGKIGDPSNDDPYLGGGIPELLASAEKRLKSLKDKGEGYKAAVLEGQIDVLKSINERIKSKEKGLSINFYDPSQDRDASGKWSGGGGNLPAEKVSENINEKVSKFIEENNDDLEDGGDYEDNSNYHPIARLMRASEGWVGSNIPNKTTKESVISGVKNISDAIGDALSMYGKDSSLGGALSNLLNSIESEKKNLK